MERRNRVNIYCSCLPNDADMNRALGACAIPIPTPVGDAIFYGYDNLKVCIERKKIGDICQCILNGRYIYQAQSAKEAGFDVLALIVETGHIRANLEDGLLETKVWGINPKTLRHCEIWVPVLPHIMYSRFDQYLTELDYLAGIIVKRSFDVHETASIIKALYANFQTPPDEHNSLHQIYTQPSRTVPLVRPGLARRIAKELPNVGWERSQAVATHFRSVQEMANADVDEWLKITGIGKKTAEKVVAEIRGQQ